MVFSSPIFLTLFLPLLFLTYWMSRERIRNYLLVFFSIFFYAWGEPKAVFCMLGMIIFMQGNSWSVKQKKKYLVEKKGV